MVKPFEDRWISLKEGIFEDPTFCLDRARLVTESYQETESLPMIIRVAKSFEKCLKEMRIYIKPKELIVGNLASKPKATPIYPEFGVTFIKEELDQFEKRPFDRFIVEDKIKDGLKDIISYWKGKAREDKVNELASLTLPKEIKESWDFKAFDLNQVIHVGSKRADGDAHVEAGHEKPLKIGFVGIIKKAEEALKRLDLHDKDVINKRLFLEAVIICQKAIIGFIKRFERLAKELAEKEGDLKRKKELEVISSICSWIAENPPRTFQEALQVVWFTHLFLWIETNGHAHAIGRMDQYLNPFYIKDIKEGKMTRERALELLGCFFIKVCEIEKIRPWPQTKFLGGRPTFQAITIGGQNSEGEDTTNELSYLILETNAYLKLPEPIVIVRVHKRSPDQFILKSVESLIHHGGGLPSFFGDEVIISAQQEIGIPLNQAREYAIVACSEPVIPGNTLPHCGGLTYFNLLKVLELALYGGKNPDNGLCLCKNEKDLATFESFDELYEAYLKQLKYYMNYVPYCVSLLAQAYKDLNPTPYTSSLLDYRIEIGKDATEGGGPNFNFTEMNLVGPPNVANSLSAIKKVVFEDKLITGQELKEALLKDFKIQRGEIIRKMLLDAPKYGNDNDFVDLIAKKVCRDFIQEIKKHDPPWRGGYYGVTIQTTTANVPQGALVGATPDGRGAREAVADNISPQAGTDTKGITAMLKSVGKIDHAMFLNGNILNAKMHPTALRGEGMMKFAALIRTFLNDFKGWQIQFNIVSAKKLKEAQNNPEEYKDLIIKVAGYSAQYISLDKKLQDQLILRTENVL